MEFKRGDRVFVENSIHRYDPLGAGTIVQFHGSIIDEKGYYYVAFDSFDYSVIDVTKHPDTDSDCHSIDPEDIRHLTPLEQLL